MIPRTTWRDEWKRIVYADTTISNASRVLLLALSDSMTADGEVRRSRSELAKLLGISPRRVTDRLNEAVDSGLLERAVAGEPGRLALYVARRPSGAHARTRGRRNDDYLDDRHMVRRTRPSDGAHARTKGDRDAEREHGAHACLPISTSATTPTDVPQRPAHKPAADEGVKVASAAEHTSNPDNSEVSSTGPADEVRNAYTSLTDNGDPSDGKAPPAAPRQHEAVQPEDYRSAHDLLAGLAPERYQAVLQRARDANPELDVPHLMLAAAALVRGAA